MKIFSDPTLGLVGVKQRTLTVSVTRFGDFLHFGQLFKAFGNN